MNYRIKEICRLDGLNEVIIQCKGSWGGWRNIWRQKFALADRDYALMCAEELKEHLETGI